MDKEKSGRNSLGRIEKKKENRAMRAGIANRLWEREWQEEVYLNAD